MDWLAYSSAFGIGLLGGAHCVGMCGGIMAALGFAIPEASPGRRWTILVGYNFGRITSYALIGVMAGLAGARLGADPWLRVLAGILLIAMGLYLANWWRGLIYLEWAGGWLWRYIQPLGRRLMPVRTLPGAMALGMVWGWLPCGLVYSALVFAAARGSAIEAGAVMAAFGVGTLPAVLASSWAAERLKAVIQRRALRTGFALLVMGFGAWTLWGGIAHTGHQGHLPETAGPHVHHH